MIKKILNEVKLNSIIFRKDGERKLEYMVLGIIYITSLLYIILYSGFESTLKWVLSLIFFGIYNVIGYFIENRSYKKNFEYYKNDSIYSKIFKSEELSIKRYVFHKITSIFFIILTFPIIFITLSYFYLLLFPASGDKITLVKNDREVVLQGMSHIASKNFYNKIKKDIKYYTSNGYIYHFEGITGNSKGDSKKLEKLLGVKPDPKEYLEIFGFKGLTFQNQKELNSNVVKERIFNNDITVNDLLKENERLKEELGNDYKNPFTEIKQEDLEYSTSRIKTLFNNGLGDDNKVIKYLKDLGKKGILTIGTNLSSYLSKNGYSGDFLSKAVLDYRNKEVVKKILDSKDKKIYLNYGNLHIEGITKLLKLNGYKVISKEKILFF